MNPKFKSLLSRNFDTFAASLWEGVSVDTSVGHLLSLSVSFGRPAIVVDRSLAPFESLMKEFPFLGIWQTEEFPSKQTESRESERERRSSWIARSRICMEKKNYIKRRLLPSRIKVLKMINKVVIQRDQNGVDVVSNGAGFVGRVLDSSMLKVVKK